MGNRDGLRSRCVEALVLLYVVKDQTVLTFHLKIFSL